jgi:hypothetical protein
MSSKTTTPYLLPIEIWHNILQYIRLHPPELDGPTPPSKDFYSRHATLRGLCLTSQWFLHLARPYLYETIVLFPHRRGECAYAAGASLVLRLARTLTQNHELRPLVRNLALFVPLSADFSRSSNSRVKTAIVWKELCSLLPRLSTSDLTIFDAVELPIPSTRDSMGNETGAIISTQHLEKLVPRLVAALLGMTIKVNRLLLQGLLTKKSQEFEQKIHNLMDRLGANKLFLPDLKTLQLEADSSSLESNDGYSWGISPDAQISLPLLSHPGLHNLHIASNWTNDLAVARTVTTGIVRLEAMSLTVSTGLASIETLVRLSTGIKSLSVTLLTLETATSPALERYSDLNEMLLSRAETLEKFSLNTTLCSAEHVADQLGPLGKVTCLPKLHKLKYLSIEPHLLIDWLEVNTWPRFLYSLPPNVVWITFRFMPEHGQDLLRIWARSGLGSVLRSPRERWRSRMPDLQHIHLQPLPFSLRTAAVIQEDLAAAGITLTWQHLNQDEELPLDMAKLSIY